MMGLLGREFKDYYCSFSILIAKTNIAEMEVAFPSLPSILTSILLISLSLQFLQKKLKHSKHKLPPGPWTLPIIGSLHHLAGHSLPHHTLHNLAQLHGPIMLLRAGEINLIVFTSREAAKEVLKTHDANLANRPALFASNVVFYGSTDIAFSNGPYWQQLRRICITELLSSKRVKSFSSIRQEEIKSLLKSFSSIPGNSAVNLSAQISELSSNITIHSAFGGRCKNKEIILEVIREIAEVLSGFNFSDLFPSMSWLDVNTRRRLTRLHKKLDSVMEEVLEEHLKQRKKEGNAKMEYDLVDVLLNIKESGDFKELITIDNIKAVILDLFLAGTETSSTTIIWAMSELIKNPEVMAKVQAEVKQVPTENTKTDCNANRYLKLVIKETLRMHPPLPLLLPRQCNESCEVLGYTVPANSRLVINAWALGRSPEYWNDPTEFKPERFETSNIDFKGQHFEFLPFSAGRRICPGLEFSMAVVEETLASLLLHYDWKLPAGMIPENLDMTETFGAAASKKEPLYLIPTLHVDLLSDVSMSK